MRTTQLIPVSVRHKIAGNDDIDIIEYDSELYICPIRGLHISNIYSRKCYSIPQYAPVHMLPWLQARIPRNNDLTFTPAHLGAFHGIAVRGFDCRRRELLFP